MYQASREFENVDLRYQEYLNYRRHKELVEQVEKKSQENRIKEKKRTNDLIVEHLTRAEVERLIQQQAIDSVNLQARTRAAAEAEWIRLEAEARAANRARERQERKVLTKAKQDLLLANKMLDNNKKVDLSLNAARRSKAHEVMAKGAKNIAHIKHNRMQIGITTHKATRKKQQRERRDADRQQGIVPIRRGLYDPTPNIDLDDPDQVQRGKISATFHGHLNLMSTKKIHLDTDLEPGGGGKKPSLAPLEAKGVGGKQKGKKGKKQPTLALPVSSKYGSTSTSNSKQGSPVPSPGGRHRRLKTKDFSQEDAFSFLSSGEDEEDEHQGEQASPFGGQVLTNDHKSKTRAAKRLLGRRVTKINEGFGLARMGRQGSILQPRKQLPSQQQQQQQQRSLRRSSTLPTIDAGETSVGLKSRSYSSAQLKATDMKSMRGDNKEYSSFTDTLNSPILKNLRENAASHNSHVYVSELNTKALMSRSKSTSALYTPRTRKRHRIPRNSMQAFDTDQWMRKRGKMLKRKIAPNTKMHYWLMFDLLDQNKNGLLDMHELVSALHNIGMMVSRSELRQMISALSRKDSLTFEEFVNGFTAVSEWDKLFEIRKQRLKHQNKDPALPFVLWVPAYHRTQTLKAIMQMKGIKDKTSTGLTGLKEKSRQAGGTTLTEQWKYVQRMIASNNKDQL